MEDVSAGHGEIQEDKDLPDSMYFSEIYPLGPRKVNTDQPKLESTADTHQSVVQVDSENLPKEMSSPHCSEERNSETTVSPEEPQDKLYLHLKDNLSRVKAYALEMAQKLPAPDQCTIEGECLSQNHVRSGPSEGECPAPWAWAVWDFMGIIEASRYLYCILFSISFQEIT